MPRGDGSGPMGMGPMTGRAAGYCAGYSVPGFMNPVGGRGFGGFGFGRGFRGGGRGRGFGYGYGAVGVPGYGYGAVGVPGAIPFAGAWAAPAAPFAAQAPAPEQEVAALRDQARYLEQTLEQINKRLQDLEKAEKKKT